MTAFGAIAELAIAELPASAFAESSEAVLRVATRGYASRPGDTPANTLWEGRVLRSIEIGARITLAGRGRAAQTQGEIAIWNGDGWLDGPLATYAIDGRAVTLRFAEAARPWPSYADFETWFSGVAARWFSRGDDVVVSLRDPLFRLETPVQQTFYAGTGGAEGGPALAGKPKPLTFGRCYNVTPADLGVADLGDGLLYTYQVHDGQIQALDTVRENGVALTAASGVPAAGQYKVNLATGIFQLGFVPVGAITADVRGDVASGVYADNVSSMAKRILTARLGLTAADLDAASFDLLQYLAPYEAGIHIGTDPVAALDLIEAMLAGIGGWIAGTRSGTIAVGQMVAPALPANFSLDEGEIANVEPIELPVDINPPAKRRRVGYRLNYSPSDQLAGSVTGDDRAALANQWRVGAAFDSAIAADFQEAADPPLVETVLWEKAAAETEAGRLLDLFGPGRTHWRVSTDRYLGQVRIGHVVLLTWPYRQQLANGWLGVVTGFREIMPDGRLEIEVFG